jgi:hypothetical protein
MKCGHQTKKQTSIAGGTNMAGGYVVEAFLLPNKTDTTHQLGILQAQAWRLLAQSGVVLLRSRHEKLS